MIKNTCHQIRFVSFVKTSAIYIEVSKMEILDEFRFELIEKDDRILIIDNKLNDIRELK